MNEKALAEEIDRSLRAMVESARPGDVIVFQYSGHGTYVTDLASDESDGRGENALLAGVSVGHGGVPLAAAAPLRRRESRLSARP